MGLAAVRAFQGKLKEAKPHFEKAIALSPKNQDALSGLASVAAALGDFDEARDHYLKILTNEPERLQARLELATVLRILGRFEEAWKAQERATSELDTMIKLPKNQHKRRVKNMVSLIDLGPTIAKIAGLRPLDSQAVSGKPWNLAKEIHTPEFIFSETKRWTDSQALVHDGWKLIFDKRNREHRLYNLKNDPMEKKNILAEEIAVFESMNQKRRRLEMNVYDLRTKLNLKKENVDLSADQIEQLKKLGYMK